MKKDNSPLVVESESLEMIESVIDLSNELNLDLDLTKNQRMIACSQKTNDATKLLVEAGIFLLSVKNDCEHGEFKKLCEKHDVTPRRAQELMKNAKVTASLPPKRRAKYVELPKSKMLLLSSADSDTLDSIIENDEDFDEVLNMSYRELKSKLNNKEQRCINLEKDIETSKMKIKDLEANLSNKRRERNNEPDYVDMVRHESNALAQKILLCSDGLESLLSDITTAIEAGDPDMEKFNALAAASLLVQTRAAAAKVSHAFTTIETHLGPIAKLDDGIPAEALFTEDEMNQAVIDRADMIVEHRQEAIIRENERIAKKPRKRGAPKKLKEVK